jgi:hypothetical protein
MKIDYISLQEIRRNAMQTIENKIVRRIYGNGRGWCFTPKDFWDFGSAESVRIALFRLARKNTIRRLATGLYDYPRQDAQLGLLSPSPDDVAQAIASKDAVRVQPSGGYATNLLGLSEQVPAKIVYLTEGVSRCVKIGGREIKLKHTTPRNMITAGRISGTVIQAFRFIGKDRLTDTHIAILRKKLSPAEKARLVKDHIHAPAWMHKSLIKIGKDTA